MIQQRGRSVFGLMSALLLSMTLVLIGLIPSAAAETSEETYTATIGDQEFDGTKAVPFASSCSPSDSTQRIVYSYARGVPLSGGGLPAGTSHLRCGDTGTNNWGLRHIDLDHSGQWATIAAKVGSDWETFASWAMGSILSAPQTATYRSENNTWAYRAPIEIRDSNGNIVSTYNPRVVIAAQSSNVITSFPER